MYELEGRTALVTGAAQGLGATFAEGLGKQGASVVVSDLDDPSATVSRLKELGIEAIGVQADVTREDDCERMVATAVAEFGGLDILVNNAALFGKLGRMEIAEITAEDFNRILEVNVTGAFLCSKAAIKTLRSGKSGKIINIASSNHRKGAPFLLHYVTSKGAMEAMTRAMARELGPDGIVVNAIAPGFTLSENVIAQGERTKAILEMQKAARSLKRDQEPRDLVGALLFLASSHSDFMTGQTLVVDGGDVMV